jgi:hypothetical protein
MLQRTAKQLAPCSTCQLRRARLAFQMQRFCECRHCQVCLSSNKSECARHLGTWLVHCLVRTRSVLVYTTCLLACRWSVAMLSQAVLCCEPPHRMLKATSVVAFECASVASCTSCCCLLQQAAGLLHHAVEKSSTTSSCCLQTNGSSAARANSHCQPLIGSSSGDHRCTTHLSLKVSPRTCQPTTMREPISTACSLQHLQVT